MHKHNCTKTDGKERRLIFILVLSLKRKKKPRKRRGKAIPYSGIAVASGSCH
jgi:hypothetical protein